MITLTAYEPMEPEPQEEFGITLGQLFHFRDAGTGQEHTWNIAKVWELILANKTADDVQKIDGANVAHLLSMNGIASEIDDTHAMTRNLAVPIVAIPSPYNAGQCVIIDGWHRLRKAQLTGAPFVLVVELSPEEEKACRI